MEVERTSTKAWGPIRGNIRMRPTQLRAGCIACKTSPAPNPNTTLPDSTEPSRGRQSDRFPSPPWTALQSTIAVGGQRARTCDKNPRLVSMYTNHLLSHTSPSTDDSVGSLAARDRRFLVSQFTLRRIHSIAGTVHGPPRIFVSRIQPPSPLGIKAACAAWQIEQLQWCRSRSATILASDETPGRIIGVCEVHSKVSTVHG